jgi:hypothetical protein
MPRSTRIAIVSVTAAAAAVLGVPAAHATTVDVKYDCVTPIGDKSAVSPIDITATKSGSGYRVVMSFKSGVSTSPVDIGAGAMVPSAVIQVGGADSGTVRVAGPANAAVLPKDRPIRISDMSGTYEPKASGQVTLTAGVLTFEALGTTTTCTPGNSPGPSLTLDVAASGATGGSTAGSTAGTTAGSTAGAASGGGGVPLPRTGPADNAVALGVLGGTVLLLGAGGVLLLAGSRARQEG